MSNPSNNRRGSGRGSNSRSDNKRRYELIVSVIFLIIAVVSFAVSYFEEAQSGDSLPGAVAEARFFDVGQGDAAMFIWDGGVILIDAGTNSSQEVLVEYINELGIKTIDCAVFTHPHEDHIGGADRVLEEFDVKSVLMPDIETGTMTYAAMMACIEDEGCPVYEAESGGVYEFGDVTMTVLSPSREYKDLNLGSAVVMIEYIDVRFLFTGDCEREAELDALDVMGAKAFDCDVLKVGHHGSYTSTSEELLSAATPDIAVISCGQGNDYGHPHRETLSKLKDHGIDIYRTDREGTVVIKTDGVTAWHDK